TSSLESGRVLTLGIRAAFLTSYYPSIATQSNSHNCLKIVVEFHRHRHHRISSFDLPMNCNRFWFPTLLLLRNLLLSFSSMKFLMALPLPYQ
ncbi:hypothetical protein BHE74_00059798, partial [Ensete ventricosum]